MDEGDTGDRASFEDDPSHPIPYIGLIDSKLSLQSGKLWYGLAAAGALHNDARTRERLEKKIETYLADFHSPESIAQYGNPTVETCRLYVGLPADSAPEMFDFLDQLRPWIEKHGVSLVVRTIRDLSIDEQTLQ